MQAKWDTQSRLLLIVYGLFACANACSGTFVNVFLWKLKPDYALIGWFALVQQLSLGAIFMFGGKWVKEYNKMNCLRLGIILAGVFYAVVLLLGKQAVHWIWLLGLLLGAAMGAFWLAFNVVYFEVTDADNRDRFNGWVGLIGSASTMVAPWLAGLLIASFGETGYTFMFTASLVIFTCGVVLSFWLKKRPLGQAYVWSIPLKLWQNRSSPWHTTCRALAAQGLRDGAYSFLISLLVFVATTNELKLGTYTLISSIAALLSYYAVGRWLKWNYRANGMIVGAVAMALAIIPLFVRVDYHSLLAFGIGMALTSPLFIIPMTSVTFDLMGQSEQAVNNRVELTVLREFGLLAGRMVSIVAFIIIMSWSTSIQTIVVFLAIIGCMPVISALMMRKLVRQQK
ncbi:MFS transporter [Paenibacillus sp. UMB4589-SE434]|uniref:MFS transporter n=1 Tax=Paenibacillus sp. UMB4589-SE434 TaxID=3046314 RepID=UPI00254F8311|nr:MFS transporter [Paenibacillus sp. UMB4589-SE434]MDK8183074.1 MFS transporter [Paenibacillus sp. UMB4589-SE434]